MIKVIIGLLVGAVLVVGGYVLVNDKDSDNRSSQMSDAGSRSPATPQPAGQSAGQYIDYSADAIASTSGTKVLFFHAPWCPQCRALEADIKAQGVPAGVTIIKVDYDSNQSLRQKYGVTLQTTFVKVDDQGSLVQKYVAYDEPTLDNVKRNLL